MPIGSVKSIMGIGGKYVTVDPATKELALESSGIGPWEKFTFYRLEGDDWAIQDVNGKFVCSDMGLGGILVASRTAVGEWEKFQIISRGGSQFNIKSAASHLYVCSDMKKRNRLLANRTSVAEWETFTWR